MEIVLGKKFLGFTAIGSANKLSFREYWFGNNLTTVVPDGAWFQLPRECENPVVHFVFNVKFR